MAQAFEKGFTVFRRGIMDRKARHKNLVPNPFKSKTSSYREWERGFNAAYFEQLERVRNNEKRQVGKETSERSRAVLQEQKENKRK